MKFRDVHKPKKGQCQIKRLKAGTVITNVRDQNYKYVIVDRKSVGAGVILKNTDSSRILMNLKLGTLRQIDRKEWVTVLDATLETCKTEDINEYTYS